MTDQIKPLTFDDLRQAVAGHAAAFRCVTEYQPAGGPGDKIFPPTYEGGRYAVENRYMDGELVPCVLLDSVQSQANRMELALLDAVRAKQIELPIVEAIFDDPRLLKQLSVTTLEAPHRIADAIFRDSLIEEDGKQVMFRKSAKGRILDSADVRNATGLFGLCPTALIYGIWDSTGPRGGLGAKIQRAVVSEMTGLHAQMGTRTSSRIDPLQIKLGAGPVLDRKVKDDRNPDWCIAPETSDEKGKTAKKKEGKRPAEVNHGNVTPTISEGGFTIGKAIQTTVVSLSAIRRLRFPLDGEGGSDSERDIKARTVLAALSLMGAVLTRQEGADLRSRCHLVPAQDIVWELLSDPGNAPQRYKLHAEEATKLFTNSLEQAKIAGLPWEGRICLTPHKDLIELLRRSQELEAQVAAEEGA